MCGKQQQPANVEDENDEDEDEDEDEEKEGMRSAVAEASAGR